MNRTILSIVCALTALTLQPQRAFAGPATFVAHKTAQVAHRTALGIDRHIIEPTNRHVIRPARRVLVNHTPRPR